MKKKILLVFAIISLLICMLAISVSAQRVEDYNDTYTLVNSTQIQQLFRRYTSETNYSTEWYTDTISVEFFNEDGEAISEVPLWEYDSEDGRYYSLIWYISKWSFVTEKSDVTYNDVTTQRDKYISAKYTLSKARAVDLRFDTSYSESREFSTNLVGYDYKLTIEKPLWGIFYDVNNTPDNYDDDLRLQRSTGMGRDRNDYGCIGFEAQFEAIGNKIVVANFRDCTAEDFDADCTGNYGTKTTWYLATNLQCLYYHDEFKYIVGGIGSVYEIDLGDSIEVINAQLLRDNKRVQKIVLPNSLKYLGGESFRGSVAHTIVVGEGLLYTPTNVSLWKSGNFQNIYLSKNILTTYKGYLTKYEGNGSPLLNSAANIYFDGSLEEANALIARMISENSSYDGKVTAVDYNTNKDRGSLKNAVIFYNYNRCDAFYRGQHTGEEKLEFEGAQYLTNANVCVSCTLCGNKTVVDTIDKLFVCVGYSYNTTSNSIMQGFAINRSVIAEYEALCGGEISFGLVAALAEKVTDTTMLKENSKVVVDYTEKTFDVFEMKLSNINESVQETNLFLCAYVTVKDKTYYMSNGEINTDAASFAVNYKGIVESETSVEK